jgi:hypothetical protein
MHLPEMSIAGIKRNTLLLNSSGRTLGAPKQFNEPFQYHLHSDAREDGRKEKVPTI